MGRGWTRRVGDRHRDPYLARPGMGLIDDGACRALPLGGLGTGSIGRDFDGRFSRWHLTPGDYRQQASPGSWVAVQWADGEPAALAAADVETRPGGLARNPGAGEYEALFPFSWYRFGDATLRQWSPVIPGRERESAWPVAYFEVTLRNAHPRERAVAAALSFQLPVGEPFPDLPIALSSDGATALARLAGNTGSFALRVETAAGLEALAAPLHGDQDYLRLGADLWTGAGALAGAPPAVVSTGSRPGLAGVARAVVGPGEERTLSFALAWDLPQVRFGENRERRWWRAHTREFGRAGDAAPAIARTALAARAELGQAAERWQEELGRTLAAWEAPDWLMPALCNELATLVEGGTVWVLDDDGREEHFGTLECLDYPFYETLDVRYYSSFVLLELWPRLERLVIDDLVAAVGAEDNATVPIDSQGKASVRKVRHAAPHDLGGPGGEPFRQLNAYTLQESSIWKDLNPKLVLQVARDVRLLADDGDLAAAAWPACRDAVAYLERFDHDGDGIPENSGVPDQTYDTWPMKGISAYCGDLWLGCLGAAAWLAERAGDPAEAARLTGLRERAGTRIERALWTGANYRFDSSGGPFSETILADQLAGTWYSLLLGLPLPHPRRRIERALATVLRTNFRGFAGGRIGPVNGRSPEGGPARAEGDQADEVWVGVGWALASLCLLLDRDADAWELGRALYRTIYEESGLWFRTPEAWTAERRFRAQVYHRALAVWSVYTALRIRRC